MRTFHTIKISKWIEEGKEQDKYGMNIVKENSSKNTSLDSDD